MGLCGKFEVKTWEEPQKNWQLSTTALELQLQCGCEWRCACRVSGVALIFSSGVPRIALYFCTRQMSVDSLVVGRGLEEVVVKCNDVKVR